MFIITDSAEDNRVCVLDTDDLVEEWYNSDTLKEYSKMGVSILGLIVGGIVKYPYKGIKYFYCKIDRDFMLLEVTSDNSICFKRVSNKVIKGLCSCELYKIYKFDFDSYRNKMLSYLKSLHDYTYEYFNKYYTEDKFILAKYKLTGKDSTLLRAQKFNYTLRLEYQSDFSISASSFIFKVSSGATMRYRSLESNKFEKCRLLPFNLKGYCDEFIDEYYYGLAESLDNFYNKLQAEGFSFLYRGDLMEFSVSLSFLEKFIIS